MSSANRYGEKISLNPLEIYYFFYKARGKIVNAFVKQGHLADLKPLGIKSVEDIETKFCEWRDQLLVDTNRKRLKEAWDNFGKVIADKEKNLNNKLFRFGYQLMGENYSNKPAWLEIKVKNLPVLTGNTVDSLAECLQQELMPYTKNQNRFSWNLTELIGDDDALLGKLLSSLHKGERAPGARGKGMGVELGYTEFLVLISKNLTKRSLDNFTFSRTATTTIEAKKEVKIFLKALSTDGNFLETSTRSTDISSTKGRTEIKIISHIERSESRLTIRKKPKHTVAQLITVLREIIFDKHGSIAGISFLEDEDTFKLVVVIGEIARQSTTVNSANLRKKLENLINNNKYSKYKLEDTGILYVDSEDLSTNLGKLPENILVNLYYDILLIV
ncbi:MAG: hypothetical protein ACXAEU_02890 [Candidatus Hodarchaeales archaeon]|jgi:hypothetical protein